MIILLLFPIQLTDEPKGFNSVRDFKEQISEEDFLWRRLKSNFCSKPSLHYTLHDVNLQPEAVVHEVKLVKFGNGRF